MMLPTVPVANLHILHRFPPRIYMHDGELDLLVGLFAGVTPKAILEFGVNVGITARAMLESISGIEHYQGIDLQPGGITTLPEQWTEVPDKPGHLALPDKRFELILRPHGSFDLRPKDLISADAIFIDGDHSYGAVMHDSKLAFDLIREGGIVVWHDYLNTTVEVTAALDDIALHEGRRIYHIEGTWLAFCRF